MIRDYGRIREQRGAHIGIPDARVAHVYSKILGALRELGLNDGDSEDTVTGREP